MCGCWWGGVQLYLASTLIGRAVRAWGTPTQSDVVHVCIPCGIDIVSTTQTDHLMASTGVAGGISKNVGLHNDMWALVGNRHRAIKNFETTGPMGWGALGKLEKGFQNITRHQRMRVSGRCRNCLKKY
ncbi:uncharacterized protein BDZ99DRAFT_110846 [Mytilinidion resinicola]|uniref:Uncharacterized protein n=1 Tax=Mytilinidion resinicola TaxID=574789 RepID=A0A6A6YD46_9PEZI|nr:uncharacterized protein BDZ99DRAFT_110846 [Mytilinidion resinicola]KAF2805757.1 hypothetical protein BDZ99DRAFT_110846 [Mytilinidion resinicola]